MNVRGPDSVGTLRRNLQRAQSQIAEAIEASGRSGESVRLVAVSKYADIELTRALVEAGCHTLGESRPQSLWAKHAALGQARSANENAENNIEWHMIGHLQRNKAARTVPVTHWLHSLDSLRLAQTLHAEALKLERPLKVLIEVNATQDASKTGLPAREVPALLEQLLTMPSLQVRGLMAMSTEQASSDQALKEFTSVRELRDRLVDQFAPALDLTELSMGMSNDFRAGIAAGATMVRLGSILWEGVLPA